MKEHYFSLVKVCARASLYIIVIFLGSGDYQQIELVMYV